MKTASLYGHIRNAQELRTATALLVLEEMADLAAAAVAGRAGKDALRALADVDRDFARSHPGRYDAAQVRLEATDAARSAGGRHAEMTRAVLRGYDLAPADETHAIRLIGAFVHGYVQLEAAGSFDHSRPSSQASWERSIDAIDALLRSWPTSGNEPD